MRTAILSGGGSLGCFEGGFLYECIKNGYTWTKAFGTSTGSMNALLFAQSIVDGSPEIIKRTWTESITCNSDIYSKNYLDCLIFAPPYSYSPLRKLLKNIIDFESILFIDEKIGMTATDLISGNTVYFTNKQPGMTDLDFLEAAISSASIPPLFDPVDFKGMKLVDGGIRENVPVTKIIENWDEEQITVIMCFLKGIEASKKKYSGLIEISSRVLEIMMNEITNSDLDSLLRINALLKDEKVDNSSEVLENKKYINIDLILPKADLPLDVLEFDQKKLREGFAAGQARAAEFLAAKND